MSESEDGGPGRREVAHRLFAAEFDDADFSYSESDEERAPNYVVTPTGTRINRLFVVGVLTEVEQVNEEVLRARIVDPTGPFVVYAGQYQPDALAFLESATPPMFVAVTGKARTFEPEDGDRVFTSIRPESISEVDADTRDRWVVQAAEQTIDRVARMASAKQSGLSGDELHASLVESGVDESIAAGITLALDHYGTTGDYLQAVRDLSLDAARVVADELDEVGSLSLSPDDGTDDPIPILAETDLETAAAAPETSEDSAGGDAAPATSEADGETTDADTEPVSTGSETSPASDAASEPVETTASGAAETADVSADDDDELGDFDTDVERRDTADASADEAETVEPTETAGDAAATETGAADLGADEDEVGDFDTEFELDEDEREEIEQEYGTDFQSGTEVDEAGAAGIDTPDPEELAEAAESGAPAGAADAESAPDAAGAPAGDESVEPDAEAATSDAPVETPETATEAGADETTPAESGAEDAPDADDVDLEDAVMDVMTELNDGGGADRETVRSTVVERYGADPDAVADAIQDALMGGRCYEPEDGKLTPI
ncbi:hypothetical protein [Haloarcula pellucida]|uniref:Rpa-associated protein n=1 Tax=Haloarcula pellucida TaxID=1427151 RepID=A0A830GJS6_9EURY|nr:hypothetical protein [Halomicroarcula pellucida]MBX0347855.1 hypothetical protein [Halomicroarcula pellucida]GGN90588.1 hypothetical protein GCM10009030_12800 [Halomicroarcula pellucida]